jgi:uncharacterized protein
VTALCPGPTESEFSDTAGLKDSRLFEAGVMSSAEVARAGIDGYEAGRAIVIPGTRNRAGALGSKFAPRSISRRIAGLLQGMR